MNNNSNILKPAVFFHPGEELNDKLQEMGMPIDEFARLTTIPANVVRCIINGEVSVSADIACAFEQVTQIPATLWINMQHNYDNYLLSQQRAAWKERLGSFSQRVASIIL